MASDLQFVEYACEQMRGAGAITVRKMFGEYAVYCEGKVVALICDNQLFVKPTVAGRAYAGKVSEAPPYPGAKPFLLIDEKLDDRPWLTALIAATERELPMPAPKKPKAAKPAVVAKKSGGTKKPAPKKAAVAKRPAAAKKPPAAKKAGAKKAAVKKTAVKKTAVKKSPSVKKPRTMGKAAKKRA